LLFPEISVIPKNNCRDVEHAVRGLRGAPQMHWIAAWGVVDNDQRSSDDPTTSLVFEQREFGRFDTIQSSRYIIIPGLSPAWRTDKLG
jgi:hypothetical protein